MEQTITSITAQKKNRQRVNIYLDGEFGFGLSRIVAAWLKIGQQLSQKNIDELLSGDTVETAYQRALNFLSYRLRSITEVERNLIKHETDQHIISRTIQRLIDKKYLDDEEFAIRWVENRGEFRPRGTHMLRSELRQKGVSSKNIEAALLNLDEWELAYKAASLRAPRLKMKGWEEFRRKMYGYLARRGFNYENLSEIVSMVWEETRNDKEITEVIL